MHCKTMAMQGSPQLLKDCLSALEAKSGRPQTSRFVLLFPPLALSLASVGSPMLGSVGLLCFSLPTLSSSNRIFSPTFSLPPQLSAGAHLPLPALPTLPGALTCCSGAMVSINPEPRSSLVLSLPGPHPASHHALPTISLKVISRLILEILCLCL